MWSSGEIKQGDSGIVVSNKLDSEFQRIQDKEASTDNTLATLAYTDLTTINDTSEAELIVSPWTFWSILAPLTGRVDTVEKVSGHLTEQYFDGTFWIRSDVYVEYSGAYTSYKDLGPGYFMTRAHLDEYEQTLQGEFIATNGSNAMQSGYTPTEDDHVSTKKYVDAKVSAFDAIIDSSYTEYPASAAGDTAFSAPLNGKNFVVYKNGVLQRRAKYSYSGSGFTFVTPLDDKDEITLLIVGGQ